MEDHQIYHSRQRKIIRSITPALRAPLLSALHQTRPSMSARQFRPLHDQGGLAAVARALRSAPPPAAPTPAAVVPPPPPGAAADEDAGEDADARAARKLERKQRRRSEQAAEEAAAAAAAAAAAPRRRRRDADQEEATPARSRSPVVADDAHPLVRAAAARCCRSVGMTRGRATQVQRHAAVRDWAGAAAPPPPLPAAAAAPASRTFRDVYTERFMDSFQEELEALQCARPRALRPPAQRAATR
jgi:hypothetical protein